MGAQVEGVSVFASRATVVVAEMCGILELIKGPGEAQQFEEAIWLMQKTLEALGREMEGTVREMQHLKRVHRSFHLSRRKGVV